MILHRFLAATLAFVGVSAQIPVQSPVRVSVFYESRCPDSVNFIVYQLKPTFDALGSSRMEVDFVPYGKATHTANGAGFTFVNQHGPPEYRDNKMHACAIATLAGTQPAATISFVACALGRPELAASTDDACFNAIGQADKSQIKRCYEGAQGDQLLASHGDRTHGLSPKILLHPNSGFIPRVVIDGVYDSTEGRMAKENLKSLICSKLHRTQPQQQQECLEATPTSQLTRRSLQSYPQISPNYPQSSSQVPSNIPTAYSSYPSYQTVNDNQGYQPQAASTYPGYQTQTAPGGYPEYQPQATYPYPGYPTQSLYTYPGYPVQRHTQYPGFPIQTYPQSPGYAPQHYPLHSGYPTQSQTRYPVYATQNYPEQTIPENHGC